MMHKQNVNSIKNVILTETVRINLSVFVSQYTHTDLQGSDTGSLCTN